MNYGRADTRNFNLFIDARFVKRIRLKRRHQVKTAQRKTPQSIVNTRFNTKYGRGWTRTIKPITYAALKIHLHIRVTRVGTLDFTLKFYSFMFTKFITASFKT